MIDKMEKFCKVPQEKRLPMDSHILIKFFGTKKYAEEFLDGHLYMNTLHYFQEEYAVKSAAEEIDAQILANSKMNPDTIGFEIKRNLTPLQADILEGTVYSRDILSDLAYLEQDFGSLLLSDPIIRSIGFQYCNVLCFYQFAYHIDHKDFFDLVQYEILSMEDFGKTVVIIDDEAEFVSRIGRELPVRSK